MFSKLGRLFRTHSARPRAQLRVEALENRTLLATRFVVPVRKEPSCEVQAEKAGPTGYRPEHYF